MKKILLRILATILVIISVCLICYPFISNYLMSLNQDSEILAYQEEVKNVDKSLKEDEYLKARRYNDSFFSKVVITDPFDPNFNLPKDEEYEKILNFGKYGIMGTLEIPTINVKLPIYHGTSEDVLARGVGHLQNTSLPIGGKGSHSVLTGHTGLSTARLFTDINQLEVGDLFFTNVLNDKRAYEVCKVYVIEPNDTDSLMVYPNKDYVSLITCTPYGINTHRLIVRGKRVPYNEEVYQELINSQKPIESTWMKEYRRALMTGGIILIVILIVFVCIRKILNKRRKKSEINSV